MKTLQSGTFLITKISMMIVLVLLTTKLPAAPYPGLPTRSQNPLLQSYFIPANPVSSAENWSISHSLYITNTYHQEQNSHEFIEIDVENTRYDLQISYQHLDWLFNTNLSFISNRSGFLDQTIEDWHDFFGLPQGGRDQAPSDLINLTYQRNGVTIIDSTAESEGLADIQLALGRQLDSNSQLWFALELPSSASSHFISNDAIDLAFWYSRLKQTSDRLVSYGTIGVTVPDDKGLFDGYLKNKFVFAQLGLSYRFSSAYQLLLQADYHSAMIKNSDLDSFNDSLQMQFGIRITELMQQHQLDIFFSEDILPGHAPDITFGIRLSPRIE